MKRMVFFTLLLAVVCFSGFAQNGVIREFTGEVELKRAGSSSFVKAKPGDTVSADTIISTGFKSAAVIEVGNSTIAVRALTRLSLSEIQSTSDTETLNLKLQTGRVKVDVKPPVGTKANCTVQGPSSTASVRGTSFEIDSFSLKVLEGSVAFRGKSGKNIIIPSGMTSTLDGDGRAVDPVSVSIVTASKSLKSKPSFDASVSEPSKPGYIKIIE